MASKTIVGSTHGMNQSAFVCQHLLGQKKVGFWEPFDSQPDGDYPDGELNAWCDQCDAVFEREGDWNDTATEFADIQLVCSKCFFRMKAFNLS